MAPRIIITHPHPVLHSATTPVTVFGTALARLADDMAETMYQAPGVGLAANQINVPQSVVVIDPEPQKQENLLVLINPKIIESEGCQKGEEGCLSVPDYFDQVERATRVHVHAMDLTGQTLDFWAEDFLARVIQHELDHLAGKLFIDRLSSLKRTLYRKRQQKMLREREDGE